MQIDELRCEAWIARAAEGDPEAARQLIEHLWPAWLAAVRSSRSLGAMRESEDVVHDVVARLVEKLGRPQARELKSYAPWRARHTDKTFSDWLRIVTKNVIRDYVREQLGPRRDADEPSVKRLLNEFASSPVLEELGARPALTAAQTARELLEFAARRLPPEQLAVLSAWLEGAEFDEIGRARTISSTSARNLLRAAIATLRRQFSNTAGHAETS